MNKKCARKKRLLEPTLLASAFIFATGVSIASAQTPTENAVAEAVRFVQILNNVVIFPLIALLSAIAFLVFLWGCSEYILNAQNPQAREQGVKHITWGIIGLMVMVSAFSILYLFMATFGLDGALDCASDPNAPGCGGVVFTLPGP